MISVDRLQKEIINHPDHIITVLESLEINGIKDKGSYVVFMNRGGDNTNGCSIKKNTLHYQNWSHGGGGSLITLVQDEKHLNFRQSLEYIAKCIGYKNSDYEKITLPFGGFYKNISGTHTTSDPILHDYPESILQQYSGYSKRFFDDGISYESQKEFEIGFSHENNAISIPIRDLYGRLVGVKMRKNEDCQTNKYWAEYEYPKSKVVYGCCQNYRDIIRKSTILIGESEKHCLQLDSKGCKIGVGIGGHSISPSQARIIKSFMCENIVIMFDEGISEEEVRFNCEKIKPVNDIYSWKVSYIYDRENRFLKKNSKMSPSDLDKETFIKLYKECRIFL